MHQSASAAAALPASASLFACWRFSVSLPKFLTLCLCCHRSAVAFTSSVRRLFSRPSTDVFSSYRKRAHTHSHPPPPFFFIAGPLSVGAHYNEMCSDSRGGGPRPRNLTAYLRHFCRDLTGAKSLVLNHCDDDEEEDDGDGLLYGREAARARESQQRRRRQQQQQSQCEFRGCF